MANKGAITGKEALDGVYEAIDKSDNRMREFLATYKEVISATQKSTSLSANNKALKEKATVDKQVNVELKERVTLLRNLETQEARNKISQKSAAADLQKQRYELTRIRKVQKENAILTSQYADAYDKLGVKVAKAERKFKNLVITQGKNAKATLQAKAAFEKYNTKIREADQLSGNFKRTVGNYPTGLKPVISTIRGLVGAFGAVEGIRLGYRLIKDSLEVARAAKGIEFAFNRLGVAGTKAYDDIKASTRGLLSELDIKKSIVEFDNFNLNLEEAGTLFEFVSLRASQTGKSVEYLRDSLVEGLSKESLLRLDNLGVSANDLRREMDEFGLSVTQAFAKLAKAEIEEAGDQLDEAANGAQRFSASLDNISLGFGQIFESIKGIGAINDFLDYWNVRIKLINEVLLKQGDFLETLKINLNDLTAAGRRQNAQLLEEIETRNRATQAIKGQSEATKKLNNILDPQKEIRDVELINKLIADEEKKKLGLTIADIERRKQIDKNIAALNKERDAILGITKAGATIEKDLTPQTEKLGNVFEEEFERSENLFKAFKKTFDFEGIDDVDLSGLEKLTENIEDIVTENAYDLENIYKGVFDSFESYYNLDLTAFKNLLSDKAVSEEEYGSLAKSVSGAIFDSKLIKYENDIAANQERLDLILNDETASDAKKAQAQIEADKKVKAIRLKQAKAERKNLLIQIAIDTAVGVAKAVSHYLSNPLTAPALTGILPIIIGTGAAQAAFVAAQPLPKFFKGTDNAPKGWAYTDERGAEIHTDKRGNIKDWGSNKGARLKFLESGDKIFKASETKQILQDISLPTRDNVMNKLSQDSMKRTNWVQSPVNIEPLRGIISEEIKQGFKNIKITNVNNNNFTPKTTGFRV